MTNQLGHSEKVPPPQPHWSKPSSLGIVDLGALKCCSNSHILLLKNCKLVIFLICCQNPFEEVIYSLIVSTDNQSGKHKDRRKSSLDVRAVASRASEGRCKDKRGRGGTEHLTLGP